MAVNPDVKLLQDFMVKMAILSYKKRGNHKLTDDEEDEYKISIHLIKAFNRLIPKPNSSISDVLDIDKIAPSTTTTTTPTTSTTTTTTSGSTTTTTYTYNSSTGTYTTNYNTNANVDKIYENFYKSHGYYPASYYYNKRYEEEKPTVFVKTPDEEGDKIVSEMTDVVINEYRALVSNKWVKPKEENDDDDSVQTDVSDYESEQEEENKPSAESEENKPSAESEEDTSYDESGDDENNVNQDNVFNQTCEDVYVSHKVPIVNDYYQNEIRNDLAYNNATCHLYG